MTTVTIPYKGPWPVTRYMVYLWERRSRALMGQNYKRSLAGEGGGTDHEVEKGHSRRLERGQGRNRSKTAPDGSSYMVCFF